MLTKHLIISLLLSGTIFSTFQLLSSQIFNHHLIQLFCAQILIIVFLINYFYFSKITTYVKTNKCWIFVPSLLRIISEVLLFIAANYTQLPIIILLSPIIFLFLYIIDEKISKWKSIIVFTFGLLLLGLSSQIYSKNPDIASTNIAQFISFCMIIIALFLYSIVLKSEQKLLQFNTVSALLGFEAFYTLIILLVLTPMYPQLKIALSIIIAIITFVLINFFQMFFLMANITFFNLYLGQYVFITIFLWLSYALFYSTQIQFAKKFPAIDRAMICLDIIAPFQIIEVILSPIAGTSWESHQWQSLMMKIFGIGFIVLGNFLHFGLLRKKSIMLIKQISLDVEDDAVQVSLQQEQM